MIRGGGCVKGWLNGLQLKAALENWHLTLFNFSSVIFQGRQQFDRGLSASRKNFLKPHT